MVEAVGAPFRHYYMIEKKNGIRRSARTCIFLD